MASKLAVVRHCRTTRKDENPSDPGRSWVRWRQGESSLALAPLLSSTLWQPIIGRVLWSPRATLIRQDFQILRRIGDRLVARAMFFVQCIFWFSPLLRSSDLSSRRRSDFYRNENESSFFTSFTWKIRAIWFSPVLGRKFCNKLNDIILKFKLVQTR